MTFNNTIQMSQHHWVNIHTTRISSISATTCYQNHVDFHLFQANLHPVTLSSVSVATWSLTQVMREEIWIIMKSCLIMKSCHTKKTFWKWKSCLLAHICSIGHTALWVTTAVGFDYIKIYRAVMHTVHIMHTYMYALFAGISLQFGPSM